MQGLENCPAVMPWVQIIDAIMQGFTALLVVWLASRRVQADTADRQRWSALPSGDPAERRGPNGGQVDLPKAD